MHVYFTIPRSVVTLLRYVSIELKELITYLHTYLLFVIFEKKTTRTMMTLVRQRRREYRKQKP